MPRYAGLSPTQAVKIAKAASDDFPGLQTLLKPLFRFLPLTEWRVFDGYILIVAGARGQKPWIELREASEYDDFYLRVHEKFAPALPPDDLDWADSEPLPVPNAVEEKIRLLRQS